MVRKRCPAWIDDLPPCRRFVAERNEQAATVKLTPEEVSALQLKDLVGLDQLQAAEEMGLTRPTFQRLLKSARQKVALALTKGQNIIIEGGNYIMANRIFECTDCLHRWEEPPCTEGGRHGYEIPCPKCGSMKKRKIVEGQAIECGGHDHGHEHHHEHGHGCGGCGKH